MITAPGIVLRFPLFDGDEKTTAEFTVTRTMKLGDIAFQFENRRFRILVADKVVHEMTAEVGHALARGLLNVANEHLSEMDEAQRRALEATASLIEKGSDVEVDDQVVAAARKHGIELSSGPVEASPDEEHDMPRVEALDTEGEERVPPSGRRMVSSDDAGPGAPVITQAAEQVGGLHPLPTGREEDANGD